jgi:hypothetical protein
MDRPICKPGKLRQIYDTIRISKTLSYHETPPLFGSLGITQHLIKGDIAWLEEVRGADGDLEDLYIRVRRGHLGGWEGPSTYVPTRLTARKCSHVAKKWSASSLLTCRSGRVQQMAPVRASSIHN